MPEYRFADTPLVDDVALYLELQEEHPVNAAAQFLSMMDTYEVRVFPRHRYEFRQRDREHRGTLVAPMPLEQLAEERNRYKESSPEWGTITDLVERVYRIGGTVEHDVYADNDAVWIDDGETMQEAASIGDALPLRELIESYEMMRDMGATEDAKEQFAELSAQYTTGWIDPERDILLLYDTDNRQGYLFDTYEVDIREVNTGLEQLLDDMNPHDRDDAGTAHLFDSLMDDE